MVEYKVGNILDVKRGIIAHGCNLEGGFGAGVAGAIAAKYPQVRDFYLRTYKKGDLGYAHMITVDRDLIIANCYTQRTVARYRGEVVASPAAIELSMNLVFDLAMMMDLPVHTVPIGSGLGGLERKEVFDRLENATKWAERTNPEISLTVWDLK